MPTYCFTCRLRRGYEPIMLEGPLLRSTYQREKHLKHTAVNPSEALQSVFRDSSTAAIRKEVEEALWNGPMSIDGLGRVSFLAPSGSGCGTRYEAGLPIEIQDVTVVVGTSASTAMHQFTELSDRLEGECEDCGQPIFE